MSPYSSYVLQTVLVLVIVCVFAVAALAGARRLGLGRAHGPIELLAALPLEARRAVYLLRVGDKVFLVGASEGGFAKLGELGAGEVPPFARQNVSTFREIFGRLRSVPTDETGKKP